MTRIPTSAPAPAPARRGSFLIICICLASLMIVVSFAMLHQIRFQLSASSANVRYLLAQSAAQAGFDHAAWTIVADYNAATVTVPSDHPSNGDGTATVRGMTFLDGRFRAPFTAIYTPNNLSDGNAPLSGNDVRAEDSLLRPWAWQWSDVSAWWNSGMLYFDGKGRYYEPGYFNTDLTAGLAPIAPTMVLDPAATLPQRSTAMFFDENFCRIPSSGNPQTDRRAASYRLRYSVGVEDLSGHLLLNPVADFQSPQDYRTPGAANAWMPLAVNALGSMMGGSVNGLYGGRMEHVFQGRGWSTNADLDPGPAGTIGHSGFFKTFPLMYRHHSGDASHPGPSNMAGTDFGDVDWESWFNQPQDGSLTSNLFYSPYVTGDAKGGEVIWNDGVSWYFSLQSYGMPLSSWPYSNMTYSHALMGPQLSFENAAFALNGCTSDGGEFSGPCWWWAQWGGTPFGHAQLPVSGYDPAKRSWYQGRVGTPFAVNLMTAPPAVVSAMLTGYLPPYEKYFQLASIAFYKYLSTDANGVKQYQQMSGPLTVTSGSPPVSNVVTVSSFPIDGTAPQNNENMYGRDLLVASSSPAFGTWPAPMRSGAQNPPSAPTQTISPDYYVADTRTPFQQYPGIALTGDPTQDGQGGDDMGLHLDTVTALQSGLCVYTRLPFVNMGIGTATQTMQNFIGSPASNATDSAAAAKWATIGLLPGWGGDANPNDYMVKFPAANVHLHVYSYWLDIYSAMAAAISVFRGQYLVYTSGAYQPSQLFMHGDRDPATYQTIRDLDRLFLAELGESQAAPGSGWPQQLAKNGTLKAFSIAPHVTPVVFPPYIPTNNIRSLVDQDLLACAGAHPGKGLTSKERAMVMETMLNDFRMSFMGSSPEYSDGLDPDTHTPTPALEFRPLDLDGDGIVHCSCYPNGAAPVDTAAGAPTGAGPKPDPSMYFCLTGNFNLGHSHYYRVFSRGEVWDNRLNVQIDDATLESVLAIDPGGTDQTQAQVLYQRWFYNKYTGMVSHIQR